MGLMKNFTWKWLNTALKAVASFSFNLSIVTEAFKRLHFGVCGLFSCQNARLDTLYRYRFSVAKSSKHPNIREYSNCCRLVPHQKSISQFREKGRSCTVCRGWVKVGEKFSVDYIL